MQNILFISYYFPPRGGSGVQRAAKFAKYLPQFGYLPHVITSSLDDITATSDASLLNDVDGIPIYRASGREPLVKKLGARRLGFAISACLRPDAQILWKREAVPLALQVAAREGPRAIYSTVQPFSSAVVGLALKRRLKLPWILDFRDPWVGSTSVVWPSKLHHNYDARLEAACVREADAVVSVTNGMCELIRRRYPWAGDKIFKIHNGFDAEDFMDNPPPSSSEWRPGLRIAFAGRLYSVSNREKGARGLGKVLSHRNCRLDYTTHSARYLLEAVALLKKSRPDVASELLIEFAGNIPEDNEALAADLGVQQNVVFHGMLPHSDAIRLVSASDAVFLPMRTECDGSRSYNESGKIFEYLAQRKPILAAVPEGDAADLVRNARAGWVVNPYDVHAIKNLLIRLIEQKRTGMLQAAHDDAFIAQFERRRLTGELAVVLDSLLTRMPQTVQCSP